MRVWTFVGSAVGEGGLDEDPGHETEGAGRACLLDFDLERFLGELPGLGTPFGMGVPNGPVQDLPEAMRTVSARVRAKASSG